MEVSGYRGARTLLYLLLAERTPEESISHHGMPEWEDHCAFVDSSPYPVWYMIVVHHEPVGAIYLTDRREVGIGIFNVHRRKGYARRAIEALIERHPGEVLANINPRNGKSIGLFNSLGFDVCQVTLRRES